MSLIRLGQNDHFLATKNAAVVSSFGSGTPSFMFTPSHQAQDTFDGDGTTTVFTLTPTTGRIALLGTATITVNGVEVSNFSLSGTGNATLTFTSAPANGHYILVNYREGTLATVATTPAQDFTFSLDTNDYVINTAAATYFTVDSAPNNTYDV